MSKPQTSASGASGRVGFRAVSLGSASAAQKIAAATGSWAGDATVAAGFSPQRGLGRVALREIICLVIKHEHAYPAVLTSLSTSRSTSEAQLILPFHGKKLSCALTVAGPNALRKKTARNCGGCRPHGSFSGVTGGMFNPFFSLSREDSFKKFPRSNSAAARNNKRGPG